MTSIELNWFRLGAIGIMILAVLGALAVTDSALVFISPPSNGGVSNYTPCKDSPNISCPNGGSAGFIRNDNSTLCTGGSLSNRICPGDQISFDEALLTNTTTASSLTSASFKVQANETIVIATHSSLASANVTSVTDSLGNSFTFRIHEGTNFSEGWLELWTAKTASAGTDSVTVVWSPADINVFAVAVYRNVAGIGNVNGTTLQICPCGTSLSTTLTTGSVFAGSWIFGAGGTDGVGGNNACQDLTPSGNFKQRINGCAGTPNTTELNISDNATILPNSTKITFTVSSLSGQVLPFDVATLELLPVDKEPVQPDSDQYCAKTGDTCHINQATRSTGANVATNIVTGTAYCTGMTTQLLTIAASSVVNLAGIYAGQSRNDTGANMMVQAYLSTNAPSTTFGAGLCASGGTIVSTNKIYFATSGTTLTSAGANEYYASLVGAGTCASSCYGWFEITPQVCAGCGVSNTIQYAQWVSQSTLRINQVA